MMTFSVGEFVKCINNISHSDFSVNYIPKLHKNKRYIITKIRTYGDGSQTIWIKTVNGTEEKGPYLSTRFIPLHKTYQYDPTQQGDKEDDI